MKIAELVQKYWDAEGAEHYDRISCINADKMKKDLVRHLIFAKSEVVLDFGTGTGHLASLLAQSGFRNIIGLDINAHMLSIAKEKWAHYPVQFIRGDGLHLPFKNNSISAVVSKWVLWVMPDPEKAIEEMMRVVKPGGVILAFSSGNFQDDRNIVLKKLKGFPVRHLHSMLMQKRYKRAITTEQFWQISKDKIPLYSLDQYEAAFRKKGLQFVTRTPKKDYGNILAKLLSYEFKFSIVKGKKPRLFNQPGPPVAGCGNPKNRILSDIAACPVCLSDLTANGEVITCKSCKKDYIMENGIFDLMPSYEMLM